MLTPHYKEKYFNMKKILFLLALTLFPFIGSAQVGFIGEYTTTEKNTLTIPSGRRAMLYDSTLGLFQLGNSTPTWESFLFRSQVDTFAELDAIVADETLAKSGDNISIFTNDSGFITSFTETNNLGSAVNWANVPDVNITESSVTQHESALSITESQISDLSHTVDTDDQTASEVAFTPNGSIAATDVQAAIQEVRDEAGGGSGTPDDDSVTPAKMADGDFGDFTVASNIATLDANVVGDNEIDLTDAFSWTGAHTFSNQLQFGGLGTRYNNSNSNDYWIWATVINESPSHVLQFYDEGVFTSQFKFPASGITTDPDDVADKEYVDAEIASANKLGEETATASRTALLTDASGLVNVNNASDVTYTIPTNATVAFPIGTVLALFQEGAGDIIIAYSGGVTGEEARTFGTGQKLTLWKTATDTWQVVSRPTSALVTSAEYAALSTALQNNGTLYGTSD